MRTPLHDTPVSMFTALVLLASCGIAGFAVASDRGLTSATQRELAAARAATARYHDVAQAEADGYVSIDLSVPGEGFHWVNTSLVDADFDPAHPEILLYVGVPGENRLQLAGVEYVVPIALSAREPVGSTGAADRRRQDDEGFGVWELTARIWEHNPSGLFSFLNPRVP